jgi:intracellular multiplication protein IcmE
MASRKENLKVLFQNTRSRMIIIIVGLTLTIALIIGVVSFHKNTATIPGAGSLKGGPSGISSTPGALNQSPEYARLQNEQNVKNANTALSQGKSAIPTIIDLKMLGDGVKTVGPQGGTGSVGYQTLANLGEGRQKPVWVQDLQDNKCDQASFNEAIQNNVSASDLKQYCSCEQLNSYQYDLAKLSNICNCGQLRMLGTTALDFKKIGFGADQLKICGYSACELKGSGFTSLDLKNADYSDGELAGAGFSSEQIASGTGLPIGVSAQDVKNAGCSVEGINHLREQGVEASSIRKISGCDVMAFKNAGILARDLRNAGFTPSELKSAGFSAAELSRTGLSPKDLLDAGYSTDDLKNAGFTSQDIQEAQKGLPVGVSPTDLKALGCGADGLNKAKNAGISAASIVKFNGCTLDALKASGFTPNELKSAGFSAGQLKRAGYSPADLLSAGYVPEELTQAGFTPQEIANAKKELPPGVSANDLRRNGCSSEALAHEKSLGISASAIMDIAHCNPDTLAQAGYSSGEIDAAKNHLPQGVTSAVVKNAGCGSEALKKERDLGVGAQAIRDLGGCRDQDLLAAGFKPNEIAGINQNQAMLVSSTKPSSKPSAADIHNRGCSADAIAQEKVMGLRAEDIMRHASCSVDALKAGGFSSQDVVQASAANGLPVGVNPDDVKAKGCGKDILQKERAQGVSAAAILKFASCSVDVLKSAGFDPKEIENAKIENNLPAGVSANDVKNQGCSRDALIQEKSQGLSAAAILKFAGCSADVLKSAGFDAKEVADAVIAKGLPSGMSSSDVNKRGCSADAIKQEKAQGVSAAAIISYAKCSAAALKSAGFSEQQLAEASSMNGLPPGVSPDSLRAKGCNIDALKQEKSQGVSAASIVKFTGCSSEALKASGFNPQEVADAVINNSLPVGVNSADVQTRGCNIDALKQEKTQGISAAAIMSYAKCSSDALKAAGFSAQQISEAGALNGLPAGISPDDVKSKSCNLDAIKQEKAQGVSAAAIVKFAGCAPDTLKVAGFSEDEIAAVLSKGMGFCEIQPVIRAGCDPAQLANLGVSPAKITAINHCNSVTLKNAGFRLADILAAGFDRSELSATGFKDSDIEQALMQNAESKNVSDAEITKADCQPLMLGELRRSGISAARIKASNQCKITAFKNACFSPGAMISAGFTPDELQKVGFNQTVIQQAQSILQRAPNVSDQLIKDAGCEVNKLIDLRNLGISLAKIQSINHCNVKQVSDAGYCLSDLLASGFSSKSLSLVGASVQNIQQAQNNLAGIYSEKCPLQTEIVSSLPTTIEARTPVLGDDAIKTAGCDPNKMGALRASGTTAQSFLQNNSCPIAALKAAGFTAKELMDAATSSQDLLAAGFSPQDIDAAMRNPVSALAHVKSSNCSIESAKSALQSGILADDLRKNLGCSAANLIQAGYTPAQLKAARYAVGELAKAGLPLSELMKSGFTPNDLKQAGFSAQDLLAQGLKPQDLAAAGFSPEDLLAAGLGPKELLASGLTPEQLRKLGYTAVNLKQAGLSAAQLSAAGFSPELLKDAGFSDAELVPGATVTNLTTSPVGQSSAKVAELQQQLLSKVATVPSSNAQIAAAKGFENLNNVVEEQKKMQTAMKFQQKIQQKSSMLFAYASQVVNGWKLEGTQAYVSGTPKKENQTQIASNFVQVANPGASVSGGMGIGEMQEPEIFIKSGDILFAVIDTAVNTDEPSPILATITNGPLKGAKLIGSFNLPGNADKMIITFTTLSIQGISKTTGISAYAIDPNTGRTALSSTTNHHYLMRYGALFASTFIQGFGNAFQSADTTITIGGTGGTGGPNTTTVQNGIGRSLTSNAVIGLATLGQAWGQQAQQNMNVPTTVQVYSGTPIGVLFLQDVAVDSSQTK